MKKQLLITIILIIFGFTVFAQPGSLDLSYNSSYTGLLGDGNEANSSIHISAIQSDGKIIIGGDFTSYNGTTINRIARLNANGGLDNTFNSGTGVNSTIWSTCIQSDGKIIIAGDFISYNGILINKIARLNIDGSLDNTFNPGVGIPSSSYIKTISIQNDGKIIIGGNFTSFNGITIKSCARLNTDGTLDTTFNFGKTGNLTTYSTSIQSDGKIIIGATDSFGQIYVERLNTNGSRDTTFLASINGNKVEKISIQSDGKIIIAGDIYNKIVRLNANGSYDDTFNPGTGANYSVKTISIQNDGKMIVAGDFTSFNGTVINRIARLNANGSLDNTFNPRGKGANSTIETISIQNDGKIIIGGDFTSFNGNVINRIASLNADGTRDDSFSNIGAFGVVGTTSIQSDGKLIITGSFRYYNGTLSNGLARLNNDGTLDNTFIVGDGFSGAYISSTCMQSFGKIIIAGNITSYNGTVINTIARLNANGSLDSTFYPGTGTNGVIYATAIQSNGKIIIGGEFTSYNGIPVNRIARLNYDGSLDNTFSTGSVSINNGMVRTIAIQSDGKIIIGGVLPWFGKNIVRLNANGGGDSTFNAFTNVNGGVTNVFIQSDGKIIVGGSFSNYLGTGINRIVRLDTNGRNDSNFFGGSSRLGVSDTVRTISIQSDGKIIIGGSFTSYGGIPIPNIVRLTTYGDLDNSFNPGTGPDNAVQSTSIQTDGKIIVGGNFVSYDGTERFGILRINGNNILSNSSFDKTTILIYPNPSNGIYTLTTNEMNATKSISIYTFLGQKIYDAVISSNKTTIDISNQPTGVYLYKVFGEEGETKSGKLVIE